MTTGELGRERAKEVKEGRPADIFLRFPGSGLVSRLKLIFGLSNSDCSAIKTCHPVVFIKPEKLTVSCCFPQSLTFLLRLQTNDPQAASLCSSCAAVTWSFTTSWERWRLRLHPEWTCGIIRSDLPRDSPTCRSNILFSPPSVKHNKVWIYQSAADVVLRALQGQQNSIFRAHYKSWAGKAVGVLTNGSENRHSPPQLLKINAFFISVHNAQVFSAMLFFSFSFQGHQWKCELMHNDLMKVPVLEASRGHAASLQIESAAVITSKATTSWITQAVKCAADRPASACLHPSNLPLQYAGMHFCRLT